jgi:hypothetical protein
MSCGNLGYIKFRAAVIGQICFDFKVRGRGQDGRWTPLNIESMRLSALIILMEGECFLSLGQVQRP